MIAKLNREKIFEYIIFSIPIFFHLYEQGLGIKYIQYIPFIFMIVLLFPYKNNYKIYINSSIRKTIFLLLLVYLYLPFFSFSIIKTDCKQSFLFTTLNLIYIGALYIISSYINSKNFRKCLKNLTIGNSIGLLYGLITNLDQFKFKSILWIFTGNRGIRADFGLSHPNFAAAFLVINLICIYIYCKDNIKMLIKNIPFFVVFGLMLLLTASRTAIFTIILFTILTISQKIGEKINIPLKILIYMVIIFSSLCLLINFNDSLDYNPQYESYYVREDQNKNIINKLVENNNIIFGIGPINVTSLKNYRNVVSVTDNWYITTLSTYGIIGLAIIIFILINIVINFLKERKYVPCNIVIVLIIYGYFENIIFNPGVFLSFFLWFIIFAYMKIKEN